MTGRTSNGPVRSRDVPDGNPEVIINFGSPFFKTEASSTLKSPDNGAIKPQFDHSIIIEQSGDIDILGVCFRPEGFYPFIKTDLFALRNQTVSLDILIGQDLYNRLRDETDVLKRLSVLESFLLAKLSRTPPPHPLILESLSRVKFTQANTSIRQLCNDLKISTKHFERIYKKEIGTTPKQLFDIIRIKKLLTTLNESPVDWMELVANFGYHDQSHLCRDFQRLTGRSPTQFIAKNDRFSGHYQSLNNHVDFIQ
ncbi:MAG: helix-turn-helix transcriptional regulator [Roseivirga sp.]|nr:helix-turn-helix transcriptional regulator [Roseivirga sp.]